MVLELGSYPKPTQIAKALVGVAKTRSDLDTNRVARSAQKRAKKRPILGDILRGRRFISQTSYSTKTKYNLGFLYSKNAKEVIQTHIWRILLRSPR
jgi:hypothetical protein